MVRALSCKLKGRWFGPGQGAYERRHGCFSPSPSLPLSLKSISLSPEEGPKKQQRKNGVQRRSLPSGSSQASGQRGNQHVNKAIKEPQAGRKTVAKARGGAQMPLEGWARPGQRLPSEDHPGCVTAAHEEPQDACPPRAGRHQSQLFSGENQSRAPTMIFPTDRELFVIGGAARQAAPLR